MPDGEELAPIAPEPASSPTDEQVAQNWFDEWSAQIEEKLSHLEQAITHVAQSQKTGVSSSAGPTPNPQPSHQTGNQEPQGRSSAPAPVSSTGQSGGQATESVTISTQPEHAPQPGHWYFKRIWGNRQ